MRKNTWYLVPGFLLLINVVASAEWLSQGSGLNRPNRNIMSMSAVSDRVVWAVAVDAGDITQSAPEFIRTTDGGMTWTGARVAEAPEGFVILDVFAWDANTAWVAMNDFGDAGGIFRTTNGGASWTWQTTAKGPALWVYFFDAQHGVAANYNLIYTTADGGSNWVRVPLQEIPGFLPGESHVISSGNNSRAQAGDTIWIGTTQGRVIRSTDRGHHWKAFETGLGRAVGINSLAFQDSMNGLAVSCVDNYFYLIPNRVARTTDGGATWREIPAPSAPTAASLANVPGAKGTYVLVSASEEPGSAYTKDSGTTWTVIDKGAYNSVAFVTPNVGWAGGFIPSSAQAGMYKWAGSTLSDNAIAGRSIAPN